MFEHTVKSFLNHFGVVSGKPNRYYLTLLSRHFSKIPYENATKIIKRKESLLTGSVPLRYPDELWRDYITYGSGGTCFSLCYFFIRILEFCGFPSYLALCDRRYGADTHCVIFSFCEGKKYLLDPGFLIEQPILMQANSFEVQYHLGTILLNYQDFQKITFETLINGVCKYRYCLKDIPVLEADFIQAWLKSFDFKGLDDVVVTRLINNKQVYLHGKHIRDMTTSKSHTFEKGNNLIFKDLGIDFDLIKKAYSLT